MMCFDLEEDNQNADNDEARNSNKSRTDRNLGNLLLLFSG